MAYGTVEEMNAYLALTGRSIPTAQQTYALEAGSMYIDTVYWDDFCGAAATPDSAFPRAGSALVPTRVKRAAFEAAYLWSQDPTALSGGGTANGQVTREKVDVIEVSYATAQGGDFLAGSTPKYSIIDGLLRPYICVTPTGSGGYAFVV